MALPEIFNGERDKNGKLIASKNSIQLRYYQPPFNGGIRVTGEMKFRTTAEFPSYSHSRWHCGIDCVPNSSMSAVYAAASGKVVVAGLGSIVGEMGYRVVINHSDDKYQSIYAHLSQVNCKPGDFVKQGTQIGVMGGSGKGGKKEYPLHLHWQVMKVQGEGQVPVNDYANPTNVLNPLCLLYPKDPTKWGTGHNKNMIPDNISMYCDADGIKWEYTAGGEGTVGESSELNVSAGGGKLLSPSTDERKYGVSVYDTVQPLIRSSTAAGVNGAAEMGTNAANEAIRSYAKYLYYYLNSQVTRANVNCISMPWMRPGFNVWIDPLNVDQVYYVDSVSHSGSPSGGVYTTLGLTFGRDRMRFASDGYKFGALKSNDSDNVFVNSIEIGASSFGEILDSKSDFDAVKSKIEKYYSQDTSNSTKAEEDSLLTYLYGE